MTIREKFLEKISDLEDDYIDRMAEVGARLDSVIRNAQNGATIEEIISDLKELQSEVW